MKATARTMTTDQLDTIGGRLRHARENLGLSRRALAERADVSDRTIEHYEAGTVEASVEKLSALARALDISLAWLITGQEIEAVDPTPSATPTIVPTPLAPAPVPDNASSFRGVLERLDELREEGFAQNPRQTAALIDEARHSARYCETLDLAAIAEDRDLAHVEAHMPEAVEAPRPGDPDPHDIWADVDGGTANEPERVCREIVERLIDTAIFGYDLYTVDMDRLAATAAEFNISPEGFVRSGWRDHHEIVPAIRKKIREVSILGKKPELGPNQEDL